MRTNKEDVDAYIKTLPEDQAQHHTAIRSLMKTVFDKEVEESLMFSVPTYHVRGKIKLSVQTAIHYTALYLYDKSVLNAFCEQFQEYRSGRNCIRIHRSENPIYKVEWIAKEIESKHE